MPKHRDAKWYLLNVSVDGGRRIQGGGGEKGEKNGTTVIA